MNDKGKLTTNCNTVSIFIWMCLTMLCAGSDANYMICWSNLLLTIISIFFIPLVGTIYSVYLRITNYTIVPNESRKNLINKMPLIITIGLTGLLTTVLSAEYFYFSSLNKDIFHHNFDFGKYTHTINTGIKSMLFYGILLMIYSIAFAIVEPKKNK